MPALWRVVMDVFLPAWFVRGLSIFALMPAYLRMRPKVLCPIGPLMYLVFPGVVIDIEEKGRVRLHHGLGAQGHIQVIEGHWAALIICCPCLWGKGPVALTPPGLGDSFVHLQVPVAQVVSVLRDVTDFELQAFMGCPQPKVSDEQPPYSRHYLHGAARPEAALFPKLVDLIFGQGSLSIWPVALPRLFEEGPLGLDHLLGHLELRGSHDGIGVPLLPQVPLYGPVG